MDCIDVSQLHELELSNNLRVDDPQVIVNSLVEHHVIHNLVHLLPHSSKLVDSVQVDPLQQFVCFGVCFCSLNQTPNELDYPLILVINAEVEAEKQNEWVLLDESRVLTDTIDDFHVQEHPLFGHLFSQAVCLLEPVGELVVEVNLFLKPIPKHFFSIPQSGGASLVRPFVLLLLLFFKPRVPDFAHESSDFIGLETISYRRPSFAP